MRTKPWFVESCLEFLESLTGPEVYAFEWGCGGSTVWLASRCKKVVSVEHDEAWAWKVASVVPDVEIRLVPSQGKDTGDPSDPDGCWSKCRVGNFWAYVAEVEQEEPDLVLVDGRARASCLKAGAKALKPGGWLVLDNAERDWYTVSFLEEWERHNFQDGDWITTFWRKPDEH